uniref:Uncharacterized protein n=1 Tax=Leersia perrieri TaxID=77586 RepID=A0A0D9XP95_9ORYZ
MADSSSTPPPTFIGYPIYYSAATRAPAYGMGSRGELVATVSSGPPENVVSWTTVAEPGHWFYVSPPPGQK